MLTRIAIGTLVLLLLTACGDDGPNVPDPGTVASRLPSNLPSVPPLPSLPTSLPTSLPSDLPSVPTSLPSVSLPPGVTGMKQFISTVRARVPEVAKGRADAEIAAVGIAACTNLKAGRSADEIVTVTRSLGTLDAQAVDDATARELVKLAIDTMCPGEKDRVDEF